MINLNSTLPGAPNGGQNVAWQEDGSGNVSAYTSLGTPKATVGSVAGVLTLNLANTSSFLINLTQNVTSIVLTNPTDGQEITLLWIQNATGTWTVTFPANILGATAPSVGANTVSCQKFTYNAGDTNLYATGVGATGM